MFKSVTNLVLSKHKFLHKVEFSEITAIRPFKCNRPIYFSPT